MRRYATLCGLAGVPVADSIAAKAVPPVPPVDSLDMWPLLSGATSVSPRSEILLEEVALLSTAVSPGIISGAPHLWKLLTGSQPGAAWGGPVYPNTSSIAVSSVHVDCGTGCLFDLTADPHELSDLSHSQPEVRSLALCTASRRWLVEIPTATRNRVCLADTHSSSPTPRAGYTPFLPTSDPVAYYFQVLQAMVSRLTALRPSIWKRFVNMSASDPACMKAAFGLYGGFLGPYMEVPEMAALQAMN